MNQAASLRAQAETLGQSLPALLAEAEHLAATLMLGEHGRRRAGQGDEFWQYRPAHAGDPARAIDWRRSARSDAHFVREREWQVAQSVSLWIDSANAMRFSGDPARGTKADRARVLGLALAVLLLRGGERVGLSGMMPKPGRAQMMSLLDGLQTEDSQDYGAADVTGMAAHSRAVFLSDFLGNLDVTEQAMITAADRGIRGVLLQVLDPAEEDFPFQGRTIFESMQGALRHETQSAGDLRARYLVRLAERKDALTRLAAATGWHYHCHHTGAPAQAALLWAYRALEARA